MKCDGCLCVINDGSAFKCCSKSCGKKYCKLCAAVGTKQVDMSAWKCPACCASERKVGDKNSTPVRPSNDAQNVTIRKKQSSVTPGLTPSPAAPSPSAATTPMTSEVGELTTEIRRLTQEITSLKDRLETATASLNSCHKRLDELGEAVTSSNVRINKLEESEKQVQSLKATVQHLQLEINIQAQNNIRNEVEIIGIPETKNESLMHVVLTATSKIGVELNTLDVDWVSRSGPFKKTKNDSTSNLPRPIVFRLLRRIKRDEIVKAAKIRRNINLADFQLGGTDKPVYLNERLTKDSRRLFRDARLLSKQHSFAYCWLSNGNVHVRKQDGKPAQVIRSQEDLLRVFHTTDSTKTNT